MESTSETRKPDQIESVPSAVNQVVAMSWQAQGLSDAKRSLSLLIEILYGQRKIAFESSHSRCEMNPNRSVSSHRSISWALRGHPANIVRNESLRISMTFDNFLHRRLKNPSEDEINFSLVRNPFVCTTQRWTSQQTYRSTQSDCVTYLQADVQEGGDSERWFECFAFVRVSERVSWQCIHPLHAHQNHQLSLCLHTRHHPKRGTRFETHLQKRKRFLPPLKLPTKRNDFDEWLWDVSVSTRLRRRERWLQKSPLIELRRFRTCCEFDWRCTGLSREWSDVWRWLPTWSDCDEVGCRGGWRGGKRGLMKGIGG